MVRDQFLDVFGVFHRQIVAQAGADQHLLDAGQGAGGAVQRFQRSVIGVEVLADAGVDATRLAAGGFDLRVFAGQPVHVGGRPAEVGNDAGKTGHTVADFLDFADDGFLRTVLDDAPFVLGDGAEGAAAKAAAQLMMSARVLMPIGRCNET